MWQGHETKLVAVFGWLAWLADFHCRQTVSCRGFTWMLVCLAQREIVIGKLLFLSVLAFVSPLYGKRPAQVEPVQLCKKQKTLKTGDASSTFPRLGVTEALRNARRCSGLEVKPQPQLSDDLGQAFPFVPQLFLAVLMSAYSIDALRAVLSTERVQALEIWQDFSDEVDASLEDMLPGREQLLYDEYLRRFSNICVSMGTVTIKSEGARVEELRGEGMIFGKARGDGNCLISSVLQGLVQNEMLPKVLVEDPHRLQAEVQSCRVALVSLPAEDPLRPVQRDLRTHRVRADASDEEHASAYLQFDVHTRWIVEYYLNRHGHFIYNFSAKFILISEIVCARTHKQMTRLEANHCLQ